MIRASVLVVHDHGSPEHAQRVGGLADRLRTDGFDVLLAPHVDGAPAGGPQPMAQLLEHDRVLIVWSPAQRERLESGHMADGWKTPWLLFFDKGAERDVPAALSSAKRFQLPEDYDELCLALEGPIRPLPYEQPADESWQERIAAAQSAGAIEAQESTDPSWWQASMPDVGTDDHLWDTGFAAALPVLARRIPVTTKGSTIITSGRVRHKQRPVPRCPDCGGALRGVIVVVRFSLAPEPTAAQEVAGYRCACGSEWPDPFAMRSAHAAAFGLDGVRTP